LNFLRSGKYWNPGRGARCQVYLWKIDGGTLLPQAIAVPSDLAIPNWQVVGGADFNSDGKSDLVWMNRVTGAVYVWLMNAWRKTISDWMRTWVPVHQGLALE